MLAPSHILHITHPNVTTAFIKQDLESNMNGKQVLVLETDIDLNSGSEADEDKYYDLLANLKEIQSKVQKQFGTISRVDIRAPTCH